MLHTPLPITTTLQPVATALLRTTSQPVARQLHCQLQLGLTTHLPVGLQRQVLQLQLEQVVLAIHLLQLPRSLQHGIPPLHLLTMVEVAQMQHRLHALQRT